MNPVLLALLLGTFTAAAPQSDPEEPLRAAIWGGRWLEGLRLYDELVKDGVPPSGQASYLAGWADWKMNRPEEAEPLLERAARSGFHAGAGRLQPDELLAKISDYRAAKPPAADVPGLDTALIEPFADAKTELTAPILEALPQFADIGRRIFPDPPPVRFFLFAKKPALLRFYRIFQKVAGDPHSTGVLNMVLFCEEKAHRETADETTSLALHELTHAWVAGYLRRRYDRPIDRPTYIEEGLAVYVASLWSEDVRALPPRRLAAWRARHGGAPPEFEALASPKTFYAPETANVHYLLSDLLIERLLGPPDAGAARIPALLDAYARTGDDAKAWREVTGKDVRSEYKAIVSEYWR